MMFNVFNAPIEFLLHVARFPECLVTRCDKAQVIRIASLGQVAKILMDESAAMAAEQRCAGHGPRP